MEQKMVNGGYQLLMKPLKKFNKDNIIQILLYNIYYTNIKMLKHILTRLKLSAF